MRYSQGFGRTGKPFASDHVIDTAGYHVLFKGVNRCTMALGLTTCTQHIFDAFLSDDRLKTLFHGHSYTANPVACSAGLASLDLFWSFLQREHHRISNAHSQFALKIKDHPRIRTTATKRVLSLRWNGKQVLITSYFSSLRDQTLPIFS